MPTSVRMGPQPVRWDPNRRAFIPDANFTQDPNNSRRWIRVRGPGTGVRGAVPEPPIKSMDGQHVWDRVKMEWVSALPTPIPPKPRIEVQNALAVAAAANRAAKAGIPGLPKGKVFDVLEYHRLKLDAGIDSAMAKMAKSYTRAYSRVEVEMRALQKKIADTRAAGGEVNPAWLWQEERYQSLITQIRHSMAEFGDDALLNVAKAEQRAAALGIRSAEALAKATYVVQPPGLTAEGWDRINHKAAEAMTAWTQDSDAPLRALFRPMGDMAQFTAEHVLTNGVILGYGADKMARTLRDDIAGMALKRAELIARTEVHRAYRVAQSESFKENPTVNEWTWFSALDARSCAICWTMHGRVYPATATLQGHPNCRCAMVPKTKTWAELGFDGIPEANPEIENGSAQFARLPIADQRRILGPTRYSMFDRGVPLREMMHSVDNPLWGPMMQLKPVPKPVRSPTPATGPAVVGAGPHWASQADQVAHWAQLEKRLADENNPVEKVDKDGNPRNDWATLGGGITKTYYGMVDGVMCVIKPDSGMYDTPNIHRGVPDMNGVGREVAAYELFKQLNALDPTFRVDFPVVVRRDIPGLGDSMVMEFALNSRQGRGSPVTQAESSLMSFFDGLIAHADRHGGNYMLNNADNHLVPIDHGLAFPDSSIRPWNTTWAGTAHTMTAAQTAMLSKWLADKSTPGHATMKDLLGELAYEQLVERGQYMLDTGQTISLNDLRDMPWFDQNERAENEKAYEKKRIQFGLDSGSSGGGGGGGISDDIEWGNDPQPGDVYESGMGIASGAGDIRWDDLDPDDMDELLAQGYRQPEEGEPWDFAEVNGQAVVVRERQSSVPEPTFESGVPNPSGVARAQAAGQPPLQQYKGGWYVLFQNTNGPIQPDADHVWHRVNLGWIIIPKALESAPVPVVGLSFAVGANGGNLTVDTYSEYTRAGGLSWGDLKGDERNELRAQGFENPDYGSEWHIIEFRGRKLMVRGGPSRFDATLAAEHGINTAPSGNIQPSQQAPAPIAPVLNVAVGAEGMALDVAHFIAGGGERFGRMSADDQGEMKQMNYGPPQIGQRWRIIDYKGRPLMVAVLRAFFGGGSAHEPVTPVMMSGHSFYAHIHSIVSAKRWSDMTAAEKVALDAAGFEPPEPGEPWRKLRDPLHKNWVIVKYKTV